MHWGEAVSVITSSIPPDLEVRGVSSHILTTRQSWHKVIVNAIKREHPDILYGITEGFADLVLSVGFQTDIPVAFDLHGIGFIEVLELGHGYGPRFKRILNSLQWLQAARKAEIVTIANPTLLPLLQPFCRKVLPVFGMTDINHFSPDGPTEGWPENETRLKILFAGNHYRWQGLDLLVAALRNLGESARDFQILCLGSVGRDEARIMEWQTGLPSGLLEFREAVDYQLVASYYRGADALVIPRPFMFSTYLAFPQKLVDGMATGRAIVTTNLAAHRWALETPPAGIIATTTPNDLAKSIQRIQDKELLQQLGFNARKRAEIDFSHLHQTKQILDSFKMIV